MPELPEVETVASDLRSCIIGRKIRSVTVSGRQLRRPWNQEWSNQLVHRKIRAVERRGKWIVIELNGDWRLIVHLGMTGQLTATAARRPHQDHEHLVFGLDDGKELRFRDIRRFGSATVFKCANEVQAFFEAAGLGPEPFDMDPSYWRDRLATAGRSLKAVLLDQRVVAGVGNIYADESLFEARLHPARLAKRLTPAEAGRLRRAIVGVLERAIAKRGSSIRDYVGGSGLKGGYQQEFRVYKRAGQRCSRCRDRIVAMRLAGRSTHYCPSCQPAKP